MIKPEEITKFNRTNEELEEFLLFGVAVAGKKSSEIAPKINAMLDSFVDVDDNPQAPFEGLKERAFSDLLDEILTSFKIGKYETIKNFVWSAMLLDLSSCSLGDLMFVHGVGPKTARFFLLHSRPDQELIVLDTHLLKHFKGHG